jgi:hypothetical protein
MQEIGVWTGPEEKRVDWTDSGYALYAYNNEKKYLNIIIIIIIKLVKIYYFLYFLFLKLLY